jgi:MtrB/PioB family decaheme-associated outer membrane protein
MRRGTAIRAARSFTAAALTIFAVGLLAAASGADGDDLRYHDLTTLASTVEIGTLFNSADEFKFGDYTGLVDDGWFVLGNADLRRRSPFDAERAFYYRIRGLNLGLDSRYIDAEYKRPGLFGITFLFDEMPKYQTDSARTFFRNAGNQFLTLPPGWVPGDDPTPAQMPTLESDLHALQIDHKRRTLGGELSLVLPGNFDIDTSYTRQTKNGEKLTAAMMGLTGGNPRSVVVPEPLEYTTHQIDSNIRYTTDDLQLQLQYYASGFNNETSSLAWQVPYLATGAWSPFAGFPTGVGQKATMPDNWFHQITGSGGVVLPANSRVMVNAAFGWGKQDDDFLPYTINGLLNVPLGLPRDDLDGLMKTRLVTFQFVSNPLPKLGVNVGYRWNQRDNDSPVDTYFRVRADSEDQDPANARINRPYSFTQHKVDADVSYEVYRQTKLTLMYEWEQLNRNLQEVHENNEHTFGAKLVSRPNRYVNLGARYERSYRNGSDYNCVKPLIVTEPPGALAFPGCPKTLAEQLIDNDPPNGAFTVWENQPLARKFNMANRHRNDAHGWATFAPIENLSVGTHVKFIDDDYYDSTFGLTDYRLFSSGVDLSYAATDALNFHAFYSYDKDTTDMASVTFGGDAEDSFDPANNWSSQDKDITHTVGAGMDFDIIPDRLSLGMEYLFAKSRGNVVTVRADGTPVTPFPDNETKLHDISIHGDLQITRNISMRVGYLFEKFDSYDWATELVCPACLNFSGDAAVIASGENSADYRAHVVSWSFTYRFW